MESNKGRVRNYVVSDVDAVSDVFESVLCKNGISYVHVDHEFHCFDKILRFYSIEEYNEIYQTIQFVGEEEHVVRCINPDFFGLINTEEGLKGLLLIDKVGNPNVVTSEHHTAYTKAMIKQSSKNVNDELRQHNVKGKTGFYRKG